MVGFFAALVFIGAYLGDPENNHAVGWKGKGKGTAVYVNQLVQPESALDFLGVPFRKDYIKIFHIHKKIIA
jgi:hypothetical protein